MFVSNVALLLLSHLSNADIQPLFHLSWWIGLLTGETQYTISAILLPSALFLAATPLVHKLSKFPGKGTALGMAILFAFAAILLESQLKRSPLDNHFIDVLITPGLGNFNILHLWFCGWIGYFMGLISKQLPSSTNRIIAITCIIFVLATRFTGFWNLDPLTAITKPFRPSLNFIALLSLAIVLERFSATRTVSSFFALIGKYALFSFIMHRALLHVIDMGLKYSFPHINPVVSYMILLTLTMLTIWLLCLARERFICLDKGWRHILL